MSRHVMSRVNLLIPIVLAALAGCQDATAPQAAPMPQFALGDGGVWTVNSLLDPGDGVCDDAECTLREAIEAAPSGDEIVFASGLAGAIPLTSGLRITDKDLSIDGGGLISLDGQQNTAIILVGSPIASIDVTLKGLAFINGTSVGGGGSGGIDVGGAGTALTLEGVTIRDNVTNVITGGGGGIEIFSGASALIRNSTISGNSANTSGGGIYVGGGSSLTLVNSTVHGNTSPNSGGIFNASGGSVTIVLSTISGNQATSLTQFTGGAILNVGSLNVRSTTITRNTASGSFSAGGIRNNGPAAFANSILAGNIGLDNALNECVVPTGVLNITSLGHNVAGGCGFLSAASDVHVTASQVFTEVLEAGLKDHGGPTMTHALLTRGRAVDAGYCPGETADQRGFARPVDDPVMPNALDACDIGAYELQGTVAAVADLMISQAVNKTSVKQGDLLTYVIRVQNFGPETAPNVVVTNLLSSGVTFVEARNNKGTLTVPPKGETGTVTWSVGDMLDQDNEVAEIVVTVLVRGKTTITNTATVAGDAVDPNPANNSAAITVSVAAGGGKTSGGKPVR